MEGYMNTAGSVDIMKLFTDVVDKGLPHCRICYRTSREVKLVHPNKLLQLASQLKQQFVFGSAALDKSACVICEGVAAATLRLTDAIFNAVAIKSIMQSYSGYYFNKAILNNNYVGPCNTKLMTYRDRTTYKQTEVLIVDSLGLEWSNKSNGTDKGPTRVDLTDVMRDHPPTIETVILDDDDVSTKPQKANPTAAPTPHPDTFTAVHSPVKVPTLVPIDFLINSASNKSEYAALVPHKMQIITGLGATADNFVLHEVVMQKNGSLSVPGLACVIQNGSLVHSPKLLGAYNILQQSLNLNTAASTQGSVAKPESNPTSVAAPLTDVSRTPLRSTQSSSNNCDNVIRRQNSIGMDQTKNGRFLGTQSLNNTKFKTESSDMNCISIIDIKGSSDNFNSAESNTIEMIEIDDLLSKHIDNKRHKESKRTDTKKKPRRELFVNLNKNNCLVSGSSDVIAVISNVKSEAEPSVNKTVEPKQEMPEKRPVEKGGRIDWEDKIPMDVISYMDATDPNAELILPDALPTEMIQPDELKVEAEDVIDLC